MKVPAQAECGNGNRAITMKPIMVMAFLVPLFLISCHENGVQPITGFPLAGTWVEFRNEGESTVMRRRSALDADRYGFMFGEDGKFLERKNVGWCATPPISYGDFAGEWSRQSENLIHVDVDYWGGRMHYDMRIISVSWEELRFTRETPR